METRESPSPELFRYWGSRFWLFSAAISLIGSLLFISLALPFPAALPPAVGIVLFGGILFLFMAAILVSALGLMTLLLRGFEPDARVAISGRVIADANLALLLLLLYLPPWITILGLGFFLRR